MLPFVDISSPLEVSPYALTDDITLVVRGNASVHWLLSVCTLSSPWKTAAPSRTLPLALWKGSGWSESVHGLTDYLDAAGGTTAAADEHFKIGS